jgi:hypothetical protein
MRQENPMPERVNLLAPLHSAVFLALVATMAIPVCSPARADSACLEQPNQPAAEGKRWTARYDRAKGRKCWVLVDVSTNGREVAAPQAQPAPQAEPTLASQIASLLGLTEASANAAPQSNAPQAISPQITPSKPARKPQGNIASANRTDSAVGTDPRNTGEGHAVKRASPAMTELERDALFEEFLRWHESKQNIGRLKAWPSTQ